MLKVSLIYFISIVLEGDAQGVLDLFLKGEGNRGHLF